MDLIELASTPFEAVPEFKRSPETFEQNLKKLSSAARIARLTLAMEKAELIGGEAAPEVIGDIVGRLQEAAQLASGLVRIIEKAEARWLVVATNRNPEPQAQKRKRPG
jgi:hypothetical protein